MQWSVSLTALYFKLIQLFSSPFFLSPVLYSSKLRAAHPRYRWVMEIQRRVLKKMQIHTLKTWILCGLFHKMCGMTKVMVLSSKWRWMRVKLGRDKGKGHWYKKSKKEHRIDILKCQNQTTITFFEGVK